MTDEEYVKEYFPNAEMSEDSGFYYVTTNTNGVIGYHFSEDKAWMEAKLWIFENVH